LDLFVILIIILLFLFNLWQNRWVYTQPFNANIAQFRFEHSQYNPSKQLFILQDWELYPLAGYNYLKTWQLNKINPEHPPLGKYLFGLSILLFGNPAILQIFFGAGVLILLYTLAVKFLQNKLLASLVIFLFSLEGVFVDQFSLSLLDLVHLFFLLCLAFAVLQKKSFLAALSLGLFAAAKAPMPAVAASLAILIHSISTPRQPGYRQTSSPQLRGGGFQWLKINLIALFVFFLTYLPFILKNGLPAFLRLIKMAAKIHLSHVPEYPVGSVFGVLFGNFWRTWWNPENLFWPVEGWSLLWPLLGVSFLLSPFIFWRYQKKLRGFSFIYFFSWLYFIFIASRLFFPGYLLILLPFLYLIAFKTIALVAEDKWCAPDAQNL